MASGLAGQVALLPPSSGRVVVAHAHAVHAGLGIERRAVPAEDVVDIAAAQLAGGEPAGGDVLRNCQVIALARAAGGDLAIAIQIARGLIARAANGDR